MTFCSRDYRVGESSERAEDNGVGGDALAPDSTPGPCLFHLPKRCARLEQTFAFDFPEDREQHRLEGFAVTIGPAPRDSAGQRSVAWVPLVSLSVVIAVALLAFYFVGRALSDLDAMQADMNRISERLGTLEAMNRQMGTAIGQLKRANAQLIATNRTLDHANGKLDGTDATLSRISADLGTMARGMRSIDMMRSDIDMVTRKIGDSFLFRGVKVK